MKLKKLVSIIIVTLIGLVSKVYAITAHTLRWQVWWQIPNEWTEVKWDYSIFNMINVVNSYLWFSVWLVCFLFMIINGFKLIMARGDEKRTKSAIKSLWKAVVGIAICLLAYIIVNLAVKLFQ